MREQIVMGADVKQRMQHAAVIDLGNPGEPIASVRNNLPISPPTD